jgi:hypothetical protein
VFSLVFSLSENTIMNFLVADARSDIGCSWNHRKRAYVWAHSIANKTLVLLLWSTALFLRISHTKPKSHQKYLQFRENS